MPDENDGDYETGFSFEGLTGIEEEPETPQDQTSQTGQGTWGGLAIFWLVTLAWCTGSAAATVVIGGAIAADLGTPVNAPSSGIVMLTGNFYYNGKFIMVNHGNNLISIFLHLDEIAVKKDDLIEKGQIIGAIGSTGLSTGPHLHWSVMLNNSYIDPLDLINN